MEGWVYLISDVDNTDNLYKIGVTRKKDINERMKELQTGNGKELYLHKSFKTKYPYKVEQMLHFHYQEYRRSGEWFELDKNLVDNFLVECQNKENICECLKDNPFFNKKKQVHY